MSSLSLTMNKPSDLDRKSISVLLVDDHTVVREGLEILLVAEKDIRVVASADNGKQALQLALKHKPDVILMDIAMPVLNGLEATRQIRKAIPNAKIIILSAHRDDAYVSHVVAMGAVGFLIKQTSFHLIAKAIREVHSGKTHFSPEISGHFRNDNWDSAKNRNLIKKALIQLSSREAEVLQLIAEGKTNKQIGVILNISVKTVEKHRQHLMTKLNLHDTAGLTRYAISAGIIESSVHLTTL